MKRGLDRNKKTVVFYEYIFLILMIVASLVLLYFYKYNNISSEYKILLQSVSKEHKVILNNEFNDIHSDIAYLSSRSILDLLKNKDTLVKEEIQNDLFNYIKTKEKYDQLRVLDKNGFEIIRLDKKGTFPVIIPNKKLQNKSDRYYFQDALKLRPNDIYISKLDLNKERGSIELPIKPMLRIVKPIFDKQLNFYGVMIFNYKAKKLLHKLQSSAKEYNLKMSIFNKKGEILQYHDTSYNWSFMYPEKKIQRLEQLDNALYTAIHDLDKGLYENEKGIFYIKPYYPYYLLLSTSNNILSDQNKKWYIVLSKDSEEISSLALDQVYEIIPFSIFFLLFGMIAIWKLTEFRQSLKEEEEKTRIASMTFSNTAQGIMISDEKNTIIQVNKAFTEITGYKLDELIGRNPKFLKSGKTQKNIYIQLWRELIKNDVWEGVFWNRKKDGTTYPSLLKINIFKDEKGRLKNYIAVFSDITEQMNIQKNLESKNIEITNSKEQIQIAMDELKSAQSQIIQSEKMAALGQLIAGVAHEINTPLGAINSSATNIENALNNVLIKTLHLIIELPLELKTLFLEIVKEDLNPTHTIAMSNQRAIKKELMQRLKEEGIENARRIADMIVISNLTDKVDKLLPLLQSAKAKEIIESIGKINSIVLNTNNIEIAVSRASRIVKALKNFSHQNADEEMVYGKIADGIETVLVVYHSQIKREITINKNYDELPALLCHFDELNQVWTNIIQNGIQAMNYKGTMNITIFEDEKYQIVEISDNGIGMSKDVCKRIFEPFYTTKPIGEGTGLGLDIVRKIIDKHNGKIEVESQLGTGTTFKIFIDKNLRANYE